MFKTLLTFSFLSLIYRVGAQIPMQDWRVHFSVNSAVGVANDESSVYMAAANGMVVYNTDDNSIEMLTLANGLSDLGISSLSGNGEVVVVGYANGNIDLIDGNTITNVPWIKLADIAGNKTIYSSNFVGDFIYISSGIGLVVFDLVKKEIKDTYYPYPNPSVKASCFYNDTIFCATDAGIYYAPANHPFLNDQNNWTKKLDLPAAVVNGPFSEINAFADKLAFVYQSTTFNADTLYYISGGVLNKFGTTGLTINDLKSDTDFLLVSQYSSVNILDTNMTQAGIIFEYNGKIPEPISCIRFDGQYWMADKNYGLVKALDSYNSNVIYSNSPYTDGCYRLDIQYGKVLVAGGGLTHNLVNNYFRNGVYVFEDETWTNFNHETQDSIDFAKDWDFVSVAINPENTDQFAFCGVAEGGLKVVNDGSTISAVYNGSNSTLEPNGDKISIGDMKYDDAGNLWMIGSGLEPLKVMTPAGDWYSFSLGSAAKDKYPYRLMIDSDGTKWVAVTSAGLIAFNENGTLTDPSDDDIRVFATSEGYGNLPSIFVKAIVQDLDGEVWIGTEEGLVVLYSTNNVFDGTYGEYDFNPIFLTVDGEVEKLLGETYITAIAVDGGNRKWIGTSSSGVFCLSPDGTEEIYRFTAENSPLISNNVLDIRIDHVSGEVYFATDKGLVSFRADASLFDEQFETVTVFPNPVRPDFSGPITVQGLGYASDVTITDVSGNVVLKTVSNGGTVIWDGKTLEGERVQSGVYLVWSASTEGKGRNVAKILFIN